MRRDRTSGAIAALAAAACAAGIARAQSAAVTISASVAAVAPGETVTITVSARHDAADAGAGLFGAPGIHGFGGNIAASAPFPLALTVTNTTIDPSLTFAGTTSTHAGPVLLRAAAGRGLDGGLAGDPLALLTFDLTIDPSAPYGTVVLDFKGTVVLALGDRLVSFSTSPGTNQFPLATTPLAVEISPPCLCEIDDDGAQVDVFDLLAYLDAWFAFDAAADLDGVPGVDVFDLLTFLDCWFRACA